MLQLDTIYKRINLTPGQMSELCRRWKIIELSVFGSIVHNEFGPKSDVDILVAFAPDATWNLWDLSGLRLELEKLAGRHVDLLETSFIRNPFIRKEALTTRQVLYAA